VWSVKTPSNARRHHDVDVSLHEAATIVSTRSRSRIPANRTSGGCLGDPTNLKGLDKNGILCYREFDAKLFI
jgi:hypothetical protein